MHTLKFEKLCCGGKRDGALLSKLASAGLAGHIRGQAWPVYMREFLSMVSPLGFIDFSQADHFFHLLIFAAA